MENEGKLRLLYIAKILAERTNEEHLLSTAEIMDILKKEFGISSHRTTVTTDIEALQTFGVDICKIESTQNKYFIADRTFQLPELKLLIDLVRSQGSISASKSRSLIKKLASLIDCYSAEKLVSPLPCQDEAKSENEMVLYIIDRVNTAISENRKISFKYFSYDKNMVPQLKNNGEPYIFSPYSLVQDGDRYYTVGFCEKHNDITVFRIDRISTVPVICNVKRVEMPAGFDVTDYVRTSFRMFSGDGVNVTLLCEGSMMNTVVDHFGKDIPIKSLDNGQFEATVSVMQSPIFFRWVFGTGGKIKIKAPDSVREEYAKAVRTAYESLL